MSRFYYFPPEVVLWVAGGEVMYVCGCCVVVLWVCVVLVIYLVLWLLYFYGVVGVFFCFVFLVCLF